MLQVPALLQQLTQLKVHSKRLLRHCWQPSAHRPYNTPDYNWCSSSKAHRMQKLGRKSASDVKCAIKRGCHRSRHVKTAASAAANTRASKQANGAMNFLFSLRPIPTPSPLPVDDDDIDTTNAAGVTTMPMMMLLLLTRSWIVYPLRSRLVCSIFMLLVFARLLSSSSCIVQFT